MALTAWIPTKEDDAFLQHLREALDDGVTLRTDESLDAGADAEVLVRGVPTREQVDACPRLNRLLIPYAGLPESTRTLMSGYPKVAVHNLHHNAAPTAELAVTLLLAAAKDVVRLDTALRGGDWSARYAEPRAVTLAGRTAVILGYGAIGRRVAHALKALGMRVKAVRRRTLEPEFDQGIELYGPGMLEDLLPLAQALVLSLPLTPATTGLLGKAEIDRLPAGAVLVNVGRGALVNEQALYTALRDRHLAGAGLDVWYRYPKTEEDRTRTQPAEAPFHELDNVVMSPHRGGQTVETEALRGRGVAALLNAAAAGDTVENRVDLGAGY